MDKETKVLLYKKAKDELNETEARKKQSLEQFHDWLNKHPYFKRTRRDDKFLIMFLRTKKYRLKEVFELYERFFKFHVRRPDFFDYSDKETVARLRNHIECGLKYVILDETSTEPVILVHKLDRYDAEKHHFHDFCLSDYLLIASCIEHSEKTQICGYKTIMDCTNLSPSIFASISFTDAVEWTKGITSCPGRLRMHTINNIPSIAMALYNFVCLGLSKKIKDKFVLVRNYEDLKNIMDVSKLPKDFGGNVDEKIYINESLKVFDENWEKIRDNHDYDIDESSLDLNIDGGAVESFRKLEID